MGIYEYNEQFHIQNERQDAYAEEKELYQYYMMPGSKGHDFHACMKNHDFGTR